MSEFRFHVPRLRRPLSWLLPGMAGLLTACTVGPDFKEAPPEAPESWSGMHGRLSERPITSTPNQQPADVAAWWGAFHDPVLTSLVERAYAQNLTLGQAQARVRQARAARDIAAGALFPTVDAGASATRSRGSGGGGSSTSNLFRAGFDASWEIDVFGGLRRGVEAADADLESAVYDRQDLMATLAVEVATTYFELRGGQRQLGIARRNLEAQRRTLDLTQQRLDAGFVSALDVANAKANVTQTESQIPSFDTQVRASIYALSVLLGHEPTALLDELSPEAAFPAAPAEVPVGLPSDLLQRRPDIRRASADLHAATARVGVAIADQYPRFSLTGSLGLQGRQASSLVTIADHFWSVGPGVSVPLFTGGRIEGNIEQARAVAEQATFAYRQTILAALQDVETSLVGFTREQQRRAALFDSAAANRQAVDLALLLYNAGRTDFLNVLSAQRQLYATEAQLAQSETSVATNLAALYKALGGGWDPQDAESRPTSERGGPARPTE